MRRRITYRAAGLLVTSAVSLVLSVLAAVGYLGFQGPVSRPFAAVSFFGLAVLSLVLAVFEVRQPTAE